MRSALPAAGLVLCASAALAGGAETIRETRYFEPVEAHGVRDGTKALRWEEGWRAVPSQDTGDDKLMFLAESVGERAPPEAARGLREVRVADPLSGAAGYVYLAHHANEEAAGARAIDAAARGPAWDEEARAVTARCYRIGFAQADPALLESLSVPEACGGSGRELLAAFHQTYTAEVRGLGVDLDYDRSRLESRVLKIWQGPVRVRRKLSYNFLLPLGGKTHDSIQDSDFYPYHYNYPVNLKFPAYFGMLVSSLEIEFATDWVTTHGPMAFRTGDRRTSIDGAAADGEEGLDGAPFRGWRISGPAGTFLNLLRLSKSSPFAADLRYRDGPLVDGAARAGDEAEDEEEAEEPGSDARRDVRRVGFVLRSTGTLGTRRWRGLSTTLFPKPGDERGPEAFVRLLEAPLEVSVDGAPPTAEDPAKEKEEDA